MASKLFPLTRRLSTLLKPHFSSTSSSSSSSSRSIFHRSRALLLEATRPFHFQSTTHTPPSSSRSFFSSRFLDVDADSQGTAAIDYQWEDEFHSLADSTIHDLQQKFEEYGNSVQIDGFDIDYGNEVLTRTVGNLGTYVLNKQTPNRQLWLSSPVRTISLADRCSVETTVCRVPLLNFLLTSGGEKLLSSIHNAA